MTHDIMILPENTLIEIFCFYGPYWDWYSRIRGWPTLVHVCQRWRSIVFASPRRLGLQLMFTGRRTITEMLDIWPRLPIMIYVWQKPWDGADGTSRLDNIVALLDSEHHDRICEITLDVPPSLCERITPAMQKPFPELRKFLMHASPHGNRAPILFNSFLSGPAPHLHLLGLY